MSHDSYNWDELPSLRKPRNAPFMFEFWIAVKLTVFYSYRNGHGEFRGKRFYSMSAKEARRILRTEERSDDTRATEATRARKGV
jgi:hypothetical protein